MSHWPTIPVKNTRTAASRPERPEWLVEGVLIHRVGVLPPNVGVYRVTSIWGPSFEGRIEITWAHLLTDEAGGVMFQVKEIPEQEWRVVSEMEALALAAMSVDDYMVWLRRWYKEHRKPKGRNHGNGTSIRPA